MSGDVIARTEALLAAGRRAEAVRLARDAAAAGDVDALMRLATWHLIGDPLPRDLAQCRTLLARAVAIGHVDAALMEIALTANGSGGPPAWARAVELLGVAARNDPVAADQLRLLSAMRLDESGAPTTLPKAAQIGTAPGVWHARGFLTREECAHIAHTAAPLLAPARVVDPATRRAIDNPIRNAHETAIGPAQEDLVVRAINRRIAALSATPVENGEPLTILRYAPGQQYRAHVDAIPGAANQRVRTVLLYLNEGYGGGETQFLASNLVVRARAGDAVFFDNVLPDGTTDWQSKHAGLPVTAGSKWLATRWIRQAPYDPWRAG